MRLIYPACFRRNENGMYSVWLIDLDKNLEGVADLADAIDQATDLAGGCLLDRIDRDQGLPAPTPIENITLKKNEFLSLISIDLTEYGQGQRNKSVKKTLTIPWWMNRLVDEKKLNCSQILQDALINSINSRIKRKFFDIMLDSVQFFYDNINCFSEEKIEEIKLKLDDCGRNIEWFIHCLRSKKFNQIFNDIEFDVKLLMEYIQYSEDIDKVIQRSKMIDVVPGLSIYNLIMAANEDLDLKKYLIDDK